MLPRLRYQLHGRYRTPRFRYGARVEDKVRGEVEIVGLSEARIRWPVGKKSRAKSLVVYGDLARAVRNESVIAVAHWFGVTGQTVTKWRRALGVPSANDGTFRLRSAYGKSPAKRKALALAVAQARDPKRRAKIAAARCGQPRPRHVVEAVRQAHLGTRHSDETRAKMSASHRRRGTRPPKAGRAWTKREDEWCRRLPAAEVVQRTGRTLVAVWNRRRLLGVAKSR